MVRHNVQNRPFDSDSNQDAVGKNWHIADTATPDAGLVENSLPFLHSLSKLSRGLDLTLVCGRVPATNATRRARPGPECWD